MYFRSSLLIALMALCVITACKKNKTPHPSPPPKKTDVYIAGSLQSSDPTTAVYWKNDTITMLGDGITKSYAIATAVSGTDVYILGTDNGSTVYWKNGVEIKVTGPSFNPTAITVSGSDVYIVGYIYNAAEITVPIVWKNGVITLLTDGKLIASAGGIAVSGSDVYVSGLTVIAKDVIVATYWKNGVATNLAPGPAYSSGDAIAVKGNDVYVVGRHNSSAVYWKNGVETTLPGVVASCITIDGNDVYIGGRIQGGTEGVAAYWKNGVTTKLTDGNSGAVGIAINGSDVHVLGIDFSAEALYWKNGQSIPISAEKGLFTPGGIAVVSH